MRKEIRSSGVPVPVGPFSQAIETNELVFISGQLPICCKSGEMEVGIEAQTKMCFTNLLAICKEANIKLDNAVKVTVLLEDIKDFAVVNEIYSQYFASPFPARVAYECANLPLGAKIEIAAIVGKEAKC